MSYADVRPTSMTPSPDAAIQARLAFNRLAPNSPEYAALPIAEGFNWPEALADVESGAWYLVVFRSVRAATADEALLTEYDDRAHQEALVSAGLLYYFQGQLSRQRECLSFCVWQSQTQAQAAARLPLHREAVSIVGQMYKSYCLERYRVSKAQPDATVSIEQLGASGSHV